MPLLLVFLYPSNHSGSSNIPPSRTLRIALYLVLDFIDEVLQERRLAGFFGRFARPERIVRITAVFDVFHFSVNLLHAAMEGWTPEELLEWLKHCLPGSGIGEHTALIMRSSKARNTRHIHGDMVLPF